MIHSVTSKLKWAQSASGLIIPADCKPKPRQKAFDFFAGCGQMLQRGLITEIEIENKNKPQYEQLELPFRSF